MSVAGSQPLVLVTGLSGFVAKHVARELLARGYAVRGTVRSVTKGDEARAALSAAGCETGRLEIVQADLTDDRGWGEALAGCRFVQHTASPFPASQPRDKFALVPVAKGGTLRVAEAAKAAGVERLVLTSSVVAVYHGHDGRADPRFTEADFSNVESPRISSYAVSKTLAERAAWETVEGTGMELAVLNPSLVLGPLMDRDPGTSADLVAMMMRGRLPLVPAARFGVVDVRDVAQAHVAAMERPEAAGRRFILTAGQRTLREIADALGNAFPEFRPRLPRATVPNALIEFAAKVSRRAGTLASELDQRRTLDTTAAREGLGMDFRSPEEAIRAMAESLLRLGLVRRRR
ncbi:SDR family oxidoreductase [Aureimonas populi]|uniref:SDR family oxidoreductase n=1 Tax=Aureimonas populi TaxID=1701758 RepID=A0ABW5CRU9_9HYPH|nr:aldehyde reductase [Aureimonas populi]